jgi:Ca-activated chloride channel homolog
MTLLPHLTLVRPWWLLALLPLALALWHSIRVPAGTSGWRPVVDAHLLPHVLTGTSHRPDYTIALAWLLAVLALSGPVIDVADGREATRRDSLRVLVVDLSPDAAPRLERIKLKLHALLSRPHDGETALLIYADEPYLVVPPTGDAAVVARFIPELEVDAMPASGNRPERALRMASALLERSAAGTRDIIWFTAGDWREDVTAPRGIRFSALHAGDADTPILRRNAARSGGILLAMRNDDSDLNALADTLVAGTRRMGTASGTELAPWLLLPLLPLAALRFRRGVLAVLPLLLCTGFIPESANAASRADVEARQLFDAGRYVEAADRFTDARWKAAAHYRAGRFDEAARLLEGLEDPDSLYNRANALARMGRLQDALAGYEEALRIRPNDADTLHNRDLVRSLLNSSKSGGKSGNGSGPSASDANRVAEQWLRSVPDDPGTLLRRKLQAEHQRRRAGEAERPW